MMKENNLHEVVKPIDPLPVWFHIFENMTGKEYVAPHWHRGIELSFMQVGEIDDFLINTHHFKSKPGQILVVNSQELHAITTVSSLEKVSLSIIFPYEYVYRYYPEIENQIIDINGPENFTQLQELAYSQLQGYLSEIISVAQQNSQYKNLRLLQLFNNVLFKLITTFTKDKPGKEELSQKKVYIVERLQFLTQYVNNHYQENLSLDLLANKCNISKEYLSRFFKKQMEMTVETYVNNVRAQNAHAQLLGEKETLTQVALNNGFSGVRTMNRAFQKLYGYSASDFKHNLTKKS